MIKPVLCHMRTTKARSGRKPEDRFCHDVAQFMILLHFQRDFRSVCSRVEDNSGRTGETIRHNRK